MIIVVLSGNGRYNVYPSVPEVRILQRLLGSPNPTTKQCRVRFYRCFNLCKMMGQVWSDPSSPPPTPGSSDETGWCEEGASTKYRVPVVRKGA